MQKILKFQQNLDYYLKILDKRMEEKDYLGALDTARNALTQAKSRIDKNAINILIGQIYFEMKLYILSCEYFFRAVKVPETCASAYFGIGRNLVMLRQENLALEYFDCALSTGSVEDVSGAVLEWCHKIRENLMTKSNLYSDVALAKKLIRLKRYDDAIEVLEQKCCAGDIEAKILTAEIYVLQNKFSTAREMLFKILYSEPNNVSALLGLCSLCLEEKDYCNLEINLEKLQDCDLNDQQRFVLANMYATIGNFKKSIENYLKIAKNDEFNTKNLLFLAISYFNVGDKQEALYYIGKARWIDIENPILNIYYDIFNRNLVEPPLKLITQIPVNVAEDKIEGIYSAINSGNFCENFARSLILADDLEWSFTLKNLQLTKDVARVFSVCRKKPAIKLYKKLLLSTRLNKEQKFYLTKYALLNGQSKEIDVTSDFYYRSLKFKIPRAICTNSTIKKGYCSAVSYAEINGLTVNFDRITTKISGYDWLSDIDINADENVIACLFLSENMQILNEACVYFGADKGVVLNAVKRLTNL